MPKIFVSYRHDDTSYVVTAVTQKLSSYFGRRNVFTDVDAIPAGRDFRKHIQDAVADCDVLLAVIGDRWLEARDESGTRRLDLPADFVRIELEAALDRDVPVIPVLVGKSEMPSAEMLPQPISDLAYRQGVRVRSGRDFPQDVGRLEREIERTSAEARLTRKVHAAKSHFVDHRTAWFLTALIVLTALTVASIWLLLRESQRVSQPQSVVEGSVSPTTEDKYEHGTSKQPLTDSAPSVAVMSIGAKSGVDSDLAQYARGTLFAHLCEFAGPGLRIKAQELIDWKRADLGAEDFALAQSLSLKWMISGNLSAFGEVLILQLNVVDTPTGELVETIQERGRRSDFSDFERMVNRASVRLLEELDLEIPSDARRRLLLEGSGASGETASDFIDTMGFSERSETITDPMSEPQSNLGWSLIGTALAAELDTSQTSRQEVFAVIERYRLAIQSKEVDELDALYIAMPDRLRMAFERYFGNATNLSVTFSDIEVDISDDIALVTFTRRDEFQDARTGIPAKMKLRVTSICERTPAGWKIRGVLKPQ